MTTAEPQHPGFLELALRHRYPLRRLSTARLPFCRLDSYLAKVCAIDGDALMDPRRLIMINILIDICSSAQVTIANNLCTRQSPGMHHMA
jgi:hypothetical protein